MKLSTKGRYAVRAMLDLALNDDGNPVLLKDIARREEISERYLEHMMFSLRNAGLVRSIRGAHGGFVLARRPVEINLADILRVSIGDLCLCECVRNPDTCSRSPVCAVRDVWCEVSKAMEGVLGVVSLQDLADRQMAKRSAEPGMYYI